MKPDASRVASLIRECRNLADLESRLSSEGLRFRSRRRLRRFLERSWKEAHAGDVIDVQPGIPSIDVVCDDVIYRVYGAMHGQRLVARMRPKVRDALRELLLSAEAPPASDYATERGFARLLGLPKTRELDYADAVFRRVGPAGFVRQAWKIVIVLPLLPFALPFLALSRDPISREMRACLRDPDRIARAMSLWALTRLPPHLRTELDASSFGTIHSEEMARSMRSLAAEHGLDSLTVLVGLAHQDELAYFLTIR